MTSRLGLGGEGAGHRFCDKNTSAAAIKSVTNLRTGVKIFLNRDVIDG
jgi:hypothetical protein